MSAQILQFPAHRARRPMHPAPSHEAVTLVDALRTIDEILEDNDTGMVEVSAIILSRVMTYLYRTERILAELDPR